MNLFQVIHRQAIRLGRMKRLSRFDFEASSDHFNWLMKIWYWSDKSNVEHFINGIMKIYIGI